MSDEIKETQDKAEVARNEAISPDELADIKAQLAEEQKANVTFQEAAEKKDVTIADLEAQLSEAKKSSESLTTSLKEARDQAVAKYLTMVKALNPQVPEAMISGETIEEIDASIEKGKAMVTSVKQSLEAEASAAKVPAGAPPRGTISLEGMSPKEKIAYGIQQKGGVVA